MTKLKVLKVMNVIACRFKEVNRAKIDYEQS